MKPHFTITASFHPNDFFARQLPNTFREQKHLKSESKLEKEKKVCTVISDRLPSPLLFVLVVGMPIFFFILWFLVFDRFRASFGPFIWKKNWGFTFQQMKTDFNLVRLVWKFTVYLDRAAFFSLDFLPADHIFIEIDFQLLILPVPWPSTATLEAGFIVCKISHV